MRSPESARCPRRSRCRSCVLHIPPGKPSYLPRCWARCVRCASKSGGQEPLARGTVYTAPPTIPCRLRTGTCCRCRSTSRCCFRPAIELLSTLVGRRVRPALGVRLARRRQRRRRPRPCADQASGRDHVVQARRARHPYARAAGRVDLGIVDHALARDALGASPRQARTSNQSQLESSHGTAQHSDRRCIDENLVALEALLRREAWSPQSAVRRGGARAAPRPLRGARAARRADAPRWTARSGRANAWQASAPARADHLRHGRLARPGRVVQGYESGAVDFCFQPIDPHALRSKVDVFLALYSTAGTPPNALR